MRVKEIHGLPVVDTLAARKLGTVADYFIDPAEGSLAGVEVESPDAGERMRIAADQIQRVGHHAVMLRSGYRPGDGKAIVSLDQYLDQGTLDGLEVLGDDGEAIGRLADVQFHQDTLEIESYLLASGGFLGRSRGIQPERVFSCSRELMVVRTGKIEHAVEPGSAASGEPQVGNLLDLNVAAADDGLAAATTAPIRQRAS